MKEIFKRLKEIKIKLLPDENSSAYIATISCVLCNSEFRTRRKNQEHWNASNFTRHVKAQHLEVTKPARKKIKRQENNDDDEKEDDYSDNSSLSET